MSELWTDEAKMARWLELEIAVLVVLEGLSRIPQGIAEFVRENTWMDKAVALAIHRRENKIRHDLNAFLEIMRAQMILGRGEFERLLRVLENSGESAFHAELDEALARKDGVHPAVGLFHGGMTSYDTQEGPMSLILMDACRLIEDALNGLEEILCSRALQHRGWYQMFRTHGQDAQPGTFGIQCLTWLDLIRRARARLDGSFEEIRVMKLSGAVGTFGTLDPEVEDGVAEVLGLKPVIATQILPLDRKAQLMNTLAEIAGVIAKIEGDLWLLGMSAIGEVREPFGKGQKGSSAMPHKKNPITLENGRGLATLLLGYAQTMMMQTMDDRLQRTISHSSAERMAFPDAFGCLLYIIEKLTWVIEGMQVSRERMLYNIGASRGTYASQAVAQFLIERGVSAETAYRTVQAASAEAMASGEYLGDVLFRAPYQEVTQLTETDKVTLAECFDLARWTRHEDAMYGRMDIALPSVDEE